MLDKDNRIVKVVTFFQTLPEDMLENIIGVLPVNRDIRRKISKQKSSQNKVVLLMTPHFRKIFVDAAYATIKPFISLELETAGYDEIVNSLTDENKTYLTISFSDGVVKKGLMGFLMVINILILL